MNAEIALIQADFLHGISKAGREALAAICIPRSLAKRETIFHEGDAGNAVYLCAGGNIQLYKTTPDGKEVVIKVIAPGELFGEVILFEQNRYPVSAIALRKSRIFIMPRRQFHELLARADFRNDFIAMLMRKQRYLASRIHYLAAHEVEDRLLMFLRDQYGEKPAIPARMSKKDMAAAIGATPETLSRLLTRLKKERKLQWEKGIITVSPDFWQRLRKF